MRQLLIILLIPLLMIVPAQSQSNHEADTFKGKFAFVAFYDDTPVEYKANIMTINADGSDVRTLFSMDTEWGDGSIWNCNCDLQWSPDYNYLFYYAAPYGKPRQAHIIHADGQGTRTYTDNYWNFKWSPDGKHLAYLLSDVTRDKYYTKPSAGQLIIADADGSNAYPFTDRKIDDFAWSPDGQKLAISSRGTIFISPTEGAPDLKSLTTNDVPVDQLNWVLNGTKVSFVYRSRIFIVDVITRLRQQLKPSISYRPYTVSPDGKWLLVGSTLVDLEKLVATSLKIPGDYNDSASTLKWAPDGAKLLFAKPEDNIPGRLFVWDFSDKPPQDLQITNDGYGYGIRDGKWSPDGTKVGYLSERQICMVNTNGSNEHCVSKADEYGQIARLAWAYQPIIYLDWY